MNSPQRHKIDIGASHGGASSRRPSERAGLVHYTKTADLKPHPLNEKLYGAEPVDSQLLASIESNGILEPLLTARLSFDGETYADYIISGHSRWRAAMQLGVKNVPTLTLAAETESFMSMLEIERAVIESNRQRVKTPEQKAREFTELKRIEAALAKQRQGTRTDLGAKLPESSRAREKAAKVVGLGARTAEKLEKVVEAADSGNTEARAVLDAVNQKKKSVDAAYRVVNESSEERTARKLQKRERSFSRYEQANRIIEAGVTALRQAGEFTAETQAALDWLRKVNAPPQTKVIITAPDTGTPEVRPSPGTPEPAVTPDPPDPKVVDTSGQQEAAESKARRLEYYLTAIAENPHTSPFLICTKVLGAGEVPAYNKYQRELIKCAERAGIRWDKPSKTWLKATPANLDVPGAEQESPAPKPAPEVPTPRGCYAWTPEEEAQISRLQETEGLSRPEAIRKMRAAVRV